MFAAHKLRHEHVDGVAFNFIGRHAKDFLYVSADSGDDSLGFGVNLCFNCAGALMEDKFFEFFEGS